MNTDGCQFRQGREIIELSVHKYKLCAQVPRKMKYSVSIIVMTHHMLVGGIGTGRVLLVSRKRNGARV